MFADSGSRFRSTVCENREHLKLVTVYSLRFTRVFIMNRRFFLRSGGIALASIGVSLSAPSFLERAVMAQARERLSGGRRKTLITIFQRGAVDGLNMVVPHGERAYYEARPSIAIPKPEPGNVDAAINLD